MVRSGEYAEARPEQKRWRLGSACSGGLHRPHRPSPEVEAEEPELKRKYGDPEEDAPGPHTAPVRRHRAEHGELDRERRGINEHEERPADPVGPVSVDDGHERDERWPDERDDRLGPDSSAPGKHHRSRRCNSWPLNRPRLRAGGWCGAQDTPKPARSASADA